MISLRERWYNKRKSPEQEAKDNKRIKKEFDSFKKRVMSGKHSHWFECLKMDQKFQLFLQFKRKKYTYHQEGKPFSLKRFLFKSRTKKQFFIPKNILREHTLNKILN